MLRLIRLERRIARLEARAARRAAARRDPDRRVFGEADADDDPREIIIRRLDELARRREADAADAGATRYPGCGWQGDDADRHRALPPAVPGPEPAWDAGDSPAVRDRQVPGTPPPEPMWPNAAAARLARLAAGRSPAGRRAEPGDTEAAGEAPRPPAGSPVRPLARPCDAPGAVPCGLVCRLRGGVDCRLLARRGLVLAA